MHRRKKEDFVCQGLGEEGIREWGTGFPYGMVKIIRNEPVGIEPRPCEYIKSTEL